jgi:hypothetical protein
MSIRELDDKTLEIIQQLAKEHGCSVPELMGAVLERMTAPTASGDRLLGLMADEPELMDQVIQTAHDAREAHSLREPTHG